MPQIPVYEQRSRVSGAGLGPGPSRGPNAAQALGSGLSELGDSLVRMREQEAMSDASVKLAEAQSTWSKRVVELKESAQPGAPGFTDNLAKEFETYRSNLLQQAKSRTAKRYLDERIRAFGSRVTEDALQFEVSARLADQRGKNEQGLEQAAVAAEMDPDTFMERMYERRQAIDSLQVSPIEKADMQRAADEMIPGRAAIGVARRDPDAALRRLIQPAADDVLFRSLSPKNRDRVLQQIEEQQRIRLQAEERAYRDGERAERDMQDAMSKAGDRLLAEGRLSAEWIASNKNRLAASDVRYFYRALKEGPTGGGPRDPMTYADLRDRAGRGQDVRGEAREALQRGAIGASDYDRLTGEVEQQRPGWYKRGTDFIATSSGVSDLNPDPAGAQRKAQMLDDWSAWADENPKASEAEARDAYKRIVSEYAIIDYSQLTLVKRAPRFLVGNRTVPDLDATAAETARALQDGRITREEAQRQALLIREWQRAYEAQQDAAPNPQGARK